MLIVDPVVARPLTREWEAVKAEIAALLAKPDARAQTAATARRDAFIDRLCAVRILDPACGSGNFLYLALQTVKDVENLAVQHCASLGLPYVASRVGPEILRGIEINPLAAELARTTIWIGDIQWRVKNAVLNHPRPILKNLNSIECRDALLNPDGTKAAWPEVEFIVGNPPFLGGKLMRRGLGDAYVDTLFRTYVGKVPAEADLVCYWFSKAWRAMQAGRALRGGLVATNSIRGGVNRRVLEPIAEAGAIFEAWSDEPWTVEGAAVRVSLVCFGTSDLPRNLNGEAFNQINADLAPSEFNTGLALMLRESGETTFQGPVKVGPFDIERQVAISWLQAPLNPNGRPNSEVLFPWRNGSDLVRRSQDKWIIDFGETAQEQAALFEAPFEFVVREIQPVREVNRDRQRREGWWRLGRSGGDLKQAALRVSRVILTPRVAKHRIFVWQGPLTLPDSAVVLIARDDDTTFGVLHSRFHEAWSLRLGTWLGVGNDPRYTPTTTFETFPFPAGLTPNIPAQDYAADPRAQRIAAAAQKLDQLRRNWLNPPDLVDIVPEVTPTAAPGEAPRRYPDRIVPKTPEAAAKLKTRTLTNLYNERPRWLADAHETLDRAVAAAYGWPEDISTEDALARLLALNGERTKPG